MADLSLSYDPASVDADGLLDALVTQYWGQGLTKERLLGSLAHSSCVTARLDGVQIGFARAVSDRTTCAYVKDMIVFDGHRRRGVGQKLMAGLLAHPDLSQVDAWYLGTKDAHDFYARFGFSPAPDGIYMFLHQPRRHG